MTSKTERAVEVMLATLIVWTVGALAGGLFGKLIYWAHTGLE